MLDLLLRLEAESESASEEFESGQEQEAVREQQPHSATSSLSLPPPVWIGRRTHLRLRGWLGEAAAVEH